MNLRRLLLCANIFDDNEWNLRYILQNAKLLEELCLPASDDLGPGIVGLHDILSPTACTLKVLHLTISFPLYGRVSPHTRLCEELEVMAGHNVLEALNFEIEMGDSNLEDCIGAIIPKLGEVLVKPRWSALQRVFFKFDCLIVDSTEFEALRSLTIEKHLSHFSELESLAFNYSLNGLVISF